MLVGVLAAGYALVVLVLLGMMASKGPASPSSSPSSTPDQVSHDLVGRVTFAGLTWSADR